MNKKYWLIGLIAGILFYVLFVLIAYLFIAYIGRGGDVGMGGALIMAAVVNYLWPVIPLGLFIGWMYAKMPKIAIFLSIIFFVLLSGLEVLILKNSVTVRKDPEAPCVAPFPNNVICYSGKYGIYSRGELKP